MRYHAIVLQSAYPPQSSYPPQQSWSSMPNILVSPYQATEPERGERRTLWNDLARPSLRLRASVPAYAAPLLVRRGLNCSTLCSCPAVCTRPPCRTRRRSLTRLHLRRNVSRRSRSTRIRIRKRRRALTRQRRRAHIRRRRRALTRKRRSARTRKRRRARIHQRRRALIRRRRKALTHRRASRHRPRFRHDRYSPKAVSMARARSVHCRTARQCRRARMRHRLCHI